MSYDFNVGGGNNLSPKMYDQLYKLGKTNTDQYMPKTPGLAGIDFDGLAERESGSIFGAGGFGMNKGTFNTVGQGIGALGDLASIYFGIQQLGLAEDQYNTNKAFGNRNIANQAQTINTSLENRYRAALANKGYSTEGGGHLEALDTYLAKSKVDGSPVG